MDLEELREELVLHRKALLILLADSPAGAIPTPSGTFVHHVFTAEERQQARELFDRLRLFEGWPLAEVK